MFRIALVHLGGEERGGKKKLSTPGFALTVAMETENTGIFSVSDLGKSQTEIIVDTKMRLTGKYHLKKQHDLTLKISEMHNRFVLLKGASHFY